MRATPVVVAMAFLAMLGIAIPAPAEDSIFVPLFTYRSGPFAASGIALANGMHDYLTLLDERDGGVAGVKLDVEECETGYDTKKGVECYEAVKGKKPSTPPRPASHCSSFPRLRSTGFRSFRSDTAFRRRRPAASSRGYSTRPPRVWTRCP
jgi:Periplasmic binding protein